MFSALRFGVFSLVCAKQLYINPPPPFLCTLNPAERLSIGSIHISVYPSESANKQNRGTDFYEN
jgi:hypothetical protein